MSAVERDLYMRYLGALGLLAECSPQVDEDTRSRIECAFVDACAHHQLRYQRTLNRLDIEPKG